MEIEDRTNSPKKETKPIELLACKQYDGDFYFESFPTPSKVKKIIRLYSGYIYDGKKYDLILVERYATHLLYLGNWNDGVV